MRSLRFIFLIVIALAILYWIVTFLFGFRFFEKFSFLEKTPPEVSLMVQIGNEEKEVSQGEAFWNPNRDMVLYMRDESGIRSYKIVIKSLDGKILFQKQEAIVKRPNFIKVNLPKPDVELNDNDQIFYEVSVNDWSNANFFRGNTTRLNFHFIIDTQPPVVKIVATSYKISYGGSALLIFKINDRSTKEVYVSNGEDLFKAFPFLKEGYYALIIAWPIKNKTFIGTITAVDGAWNVKKVPIPIIKDPNVRYRYSEIKVSDDFLKTKLNDLIESIGERSPSSFSGSLEKFKYINEYTRMKDENLIKGVVKEALLAPHDFLKPMNFSVFSPLRGSQVVGSFGDHRTYSYKDKKVSQSVHLGLDVASTSRAPIICSNPGEVLFTGFLGVYGNTTIIDHGFGVASLYSHQSMFKVKAGDLVESNTEIGLTGHTGWAFGDHLHLSILIQGQMVRVVEWMDSKWIKANITDVFTRAQKIIMQDET